MKASRLGEDGVGGWDQLGAAAKLPPKEGARGNQKTPRGRGKGVGSENPPLFHICLLKVVRIPVRKQEAIPHPSLQEFIRPSF